MNFLKRKFLESDYIKSAIEEKTDLSEFRKKPTIRVIIGVSAIIISYIICWPLISLLGIVSVYLKQPLIITIGGPLAYGMSHVVFIFGMWISGGYYTNIFLKWVARMIAEKYMVESQN